MEKGIKCKKAHSMKYVIAKNCILLSIIVMLCTAGGVYLLADRPFDQGDTLFGIVVLVCTLAVIVLTSIYIASSISNHVKRVNLYNPIKETSYKELYPMIDRMDSLNRQLANHLAKLQEDNDNSDAMRREFTANISHELKTPLTSISGYSEIIRDGLVKKNEVPEFAGKIYDEASRLITLVEDILKLSELDEWHAGEEDLKDVDIYKLSKKIISQLEPIAAKNKITLSLTGKHVNVKGVEHILNEMIYNLCDNAIKYNVPEGKVEIAINQYVDGVELSVKDTGIGIPQKDISHIFDRFYRVDKSHSKAIGGTGLGLSIVKHGANFHGARVNVKSKPGKGTTISITF